MVPLDDVSVVAPEHAEARPLLPELDGVALPLPLPLPLALPFAGKEEGSNDTDGGAGEDAPEATGGTVAFEPLPLALAGADVGEADGPLLLLLPPLKL